MTIETVSSGIKALDDLLAGDSPSGVAGYPKGRVTQISGGRGTGKTALALKAAHQVLREGGSVLYVSPHRQLGAKHPNLHYHQVSVLEDAAALLMQHKSYDLIVFDNAESLQSVVPGPASSARVWSVLLPRIQKLQPDAAFIGTFEQRSLHRPGFPPLEGGRMWAFSSSLRIRLESREGQVRATITKTALSDAQAQSLDLSQEVLKGAFSKKPLGLDNSTDKIYEARTRAALGVIARAMLDPRQFENSAAYDKTLEDQTYLLSRLPTEDLEGMYARVLEGLPPEEFFVEKDGDFKAETTLNSFSSPVTDPRSNKGALDQAKPSEDPLPSPTFGETIIGAMLETVVDRLGGGQVEALVAGSAVGVGNAVLDQAVAGAVEDRLSGEDWSKVPAERATSKREARQRIAAGAVRLNDETVRDGESVSDGSAQVQVGKRKRYRVEV